MAVQKWYTFWAIFSTMCFFMATIYLFGTFGLSAYNDSISLFKHILGLWGSVFVGSSSLSSSAKLFVFSVVVMTCQSSGRGFLVWGVFFHAFRSGWTFQNGGNRAPYPMGVLFCFLLCSVLSFLLSAAGCLLVLLSVCSHSGRFLWLEEYVSRVVVLFKKAQLVWLF